MSHSAIFDSLARASNYPGLENSLLAPTTGDGLVMGSIFKMKLVCPHVHYRQCM